MCSAVKITILVFRPIKPVKSSAQLARVFRLNNQIGNKLIFLIENRSKSFCFVPLHNNGQLDLIISVLFSMVPDIKM